MKVNYEYTKKDLKKYLLRSRLINNIILFVILLIVYLVITFNKISLMYLPILIIGLLLFIYLMNKLYIYAYIKVNNMLNNNIYGKYILELIPNKFSITVNKSKIDYKYNSIKYIKITKNSFILKLKYSREYLTFEKRLFQLDTYNKIIEMFKEKIDK